MIREKCMIKEQEINLSVTGGEITSVVRKSITKSACRVYEGGCIGVAGILGEAGEEQMEQAAENLKLKIPYKAEASAGGVRREDYRCGTFSVEDSAGFLREAEEVLKILRKEYPQLMFSNKVRLFETERRLVNDQGTDFDCRDRVLSWELLFKHVDSANIYDDFLVYQGREVDREQFLQEAREHLDAFLNPAELPEQMQIQLEKEPSEGVLLPVILNFAQLEGFFVQNLEGQAFGRGASFFNGKLGEKLFDEKFSFCVDRSSRQLCIPFFDAEGSTCRDDRCFLIRKGVLVRPYADKQLGKEFGYENTATAGGAYDSVPSNTGGGWGDFAAECGEQTLQELLGGEDSIYVSVMSGGDYTSEGNFASPVQTAYLCRNGHLTGRLPELSISGNIYEMFGKNFVGMSSDRPFEGEHKMVLRMKVQCEERF